MVDGCQHFGGTCCLHIQAHSSTPKMRAGCSSETLVPTDYQTTRRNNPEDNHLHSCRRENLKTHIITLQTTLHCMPLGHGICFPLLHNSSQRINLNFSNFMLHGMNCLSCRICVLICFLIFHGYLFIDENHKYLSFYVK
jgi:hypothetical protein